MNSCGWVEGFGFKVLMETIRLFDADIVAVIDNERLVQQIREEIQKNPTLLKRMPDIIPLKKSGSVVARSRETRRNKRNEIIKEYFYGENKIFHPITRHMAFTDLRVYQAGTSTDGQIEVSLISPATLVPGTVLAVMQTDDAAKIVTANVAGFLLVLEKPDLTRKTVLVLSPCPGSLPSQFFLKSTFEAAL